MPTISKLESEIGLSCLICDEFIRISESEQKALHAGIKIGPRVCENCKRAVLKVRGEIEVPFNE